MTGSDRFVDLSNGGIVKFRTSAVAALSAVSLLIVGAGPASAATPTARDVSDSCGSAPDGGFSDVDDSNVHKDLIDCIKHYEITTGKTATTYDPRGSLRADQLASFVKRTLDAGNVDLPAPTRDYFTDDNGNAHEPAINALAEANIVDTSTTTYGVGHVPNRAEMSGFVVDALIYAEVIDPNASVPDYFSDDTGNEYQAAINRIAHAGVVTGKGDGTFGPDETLRRDQMATFLALSIDLILDGGSPPESGGSGGGTATCGSGTPTGQLRITTVRADGPGNDVEAYNDSEYVEFNNPGTSDVSIAGWKVVDAADNFIDIPSGYTVKANSTFRVYSGAGDNVATSRYFAGRSQAMWNNSGGDTATLCSGSGQTVATYSY